MSFIFPRLVDDALAPMSMFHPADELMGPVHYRMALPSMMGDITRAAGRESEVQNTDKEFRVRLDLRHYSPEEVKITSNDKQITIHAKHEEKQDHHGYVSREMRRIYKMPGDVDPKSVTSTMNHHGVLSIKAAKLAIEAPKETTIPIEFKSE